MRWWTALAIDVQVRTLLEEPNIAGSYCAVRWIAEALNMRMDDSRLGEALTALRLEYKLLHDNRVICARSLAAGWQRTLNVIMDCFRSDEVELTYQELVDAVRARGVSETSLRTAVATAAVALQETRDDLSDWFTMVFRRSQPAPAS
jgi:hypothetical protein